MPRITELYAWVIADTSPDDEGVPAFMGIDGIWYPMIGADFERAEQLRPQAQAAANLAGKSIKLVRSVGDLELVETLEPESARAD